MPQGIASPCCRLIDMARSARIGDFVFVRHRRRDETESVRVHERVGGSFGFDCGHMASDTLAARAAAFVVRVLLDRRCPRSIR